MSAATQTAHMVIRASAGAGKTFTLSNRYLKLLYYGASPQTILATTFTRKAAGEILSRVLKRLAQSTADQEAAEELAQQLRLPEMQLADTRRMLRQTSDMLHRISVSTIDSFFHRMAQCFRHELGIPAEAQIVSDDDPITRQLRLEAIGAMLGDEQPHVLIELLRRLHHDQAQRSVTDAISRIVSRLYEVYRKTEKQAWHTLAAPEQLDHVQLGQAINRLQEAADDLPHDKRFAATWHKDLHAAMNRDWDAFVRSGLGGKIAGGEPMYYNKPIAPALVKAYQPLINYAQNHVIAQTAQRTAAMYDLLERFGHHFDVLRRENRVLLYNDLTHKLAHDLPRLGEQLMTDIYYRLDASVSHLLLDEFQDTSVEQWHVLKPFAEEIRAHDDGTMSGHTFFCVGDVKQAIYGWRGGCAELFAQVEHDLHLPAASGQTLSKSYRSCPIVLKAINRVFTSLSESPPLEEHQDMAQAWQQGFEPHQAAYSDLPGYVELITSPTYESHEDETTTDTTGAPTPHDCFVADHIAQLAQKHPQRTLAVLVRTNEKVKQLIYLLRQQDLCASGEGGTPLTDDPAVNTVLSALTMADHPGHSAAVFHVRNSPLAQIIELASPGPMHVAEVTRKIRLQLAVEGYGGVIGRWTRALAPSCGRRSIARLSQLVMLADSYGAAATVRPRDFVEYVQGATVEEPAPSHIRVMTIHRAKGLEFDLVVLPQLEKVIGSITDMAVWTYRESPTQSPAAVFACVSNHVRPLLQAHCPTVAAAYQQQVHHQLHDDLCGLYVAMTRARQALHIIIEPLKVTKQGTPGTRGLSNLTCAAILRHALSEAEESYDGGQMLYCDGNAQWDGDCQAQNKQPVTEPPIRIVMSSPAQHPKRSWPHVRPSQLHGPGEPGVVISNLLAIEAGHQRLRGSVIHQLFEMLDWSDAPLVDDDALLTAARCAAPNATDDWLHRCVEQFKHMLQTSEIKAALAKPADDVELWKERPFAVMLNHTLIRGAFDRVVIHPDRSADLIDYKTDRADDSALQTVIARYRGQINIYAAALAKLLHTPPSAIRPTLLLVSRGQRIDM